MFYRASKVGATLPATRDLLRGDSQSRRFLRPLYQAMLTTNLSDHLVLVTGGTGGIGKAPGLALASLGGSIAVHDNTAADTAEELIQQLQAKSARAKAFQANLANDDGVSMPKNHLNGKVEQISDVAPTRFVAYMPKLRHPWATPAFFLRM